MFGLGRLFGGRRGKDQQQKPVKTIEVDRTTFIQLLMEKEGHTEYSATIKAISIEILGKSVKIGDNLVKIKQ